MIGSFYIAQAYIAQGFPGNGNFAWWRPVARAATTFTKIARPSATTFTKVARNVTTWTKVPGQRTVNT